MDNHARRGFLATMAADARAQRDWPAYEVLRTAVYDLYFKDGYPYDAANRLADQMIDRCFAEVDILL
jgi:hypothetical protein